MNRIIKGLGIALGCVLIASSCSEISFGDKFLGDQPRVPERLPKKCSLRK